MKFGQQKFKDIPYLSCPKSKNFLIIERCQKMYQRANINIVTRFWVLIFECSISSALWLTKVQGWYFISRDDHVQNWKKRIFLVKQKCTNVRISIVLPDPEISNNKIVSLDVWNVTKGIQCYYMKSETRPCHSWNYFFGRGMAPITGQN